jgi:hypothetical protein
MSFSLKSNFTNREISYIRRQPIYEMDMKDAGMSVIRSFKLLPPKIISKLEALPKRQRAIKVGLLRKKDLAFSKEFHGGMRLVVDEFIRTNEIAESRVICIKNDAVFITGERVHETQFYDCT